MDTIFALSSGAPPAAIAVLRISGPQAGNALEKLAGRLPSPRRATLAVLRDPDGAELDRALVLWFPGPATATGEDLAELHLHGGRAVVNAVERSLGAVAGLRRAEAGEFTRRAFANGRIDLAEAEGLADLLASETEMQRRVALAMAGGHFSRQVDDWRHRVLMLSAELEAALDFDDEDDVADLPADFPIRVGDIADDLRAWLERPRSEMLREGYKVALGGPPNAGKSTLFNAIVESEAAITSAIPGTTRDVLERSVAIEGVAFTFLDTAGLRDAPDDAIEGEGVERARRALESADLVLWLGPEGDGPAGAWEIAAKSDLAVGKRDGAFAVSALTGAGVPALKHALVAAARTALPPVGQAVLNARQFGLISDAYSALTTGHVDPLLMAESLRQARVAFDRLTGRASTEDMLDTLFGRFCIGK
ncbi:tRNA uridine-5-carboxymethylaminomethyl(34) synthesis GTPase MnmE [Altererythrobacter aerius]|uniref:tRNA modification GTPase MnmE n=1 Tax=Tsuneonella aeria TaxID=1837929 RepID=A0A6I4TEE4_9SPHN|nr:tRNA uridine-5-carboxymethylaminomethyl(34) synthesis GTPase MnmE [Tsuneonella aeria]MXO75433.1 tRNA uridine-5-carboxymethylaminomethyl(34) synthesis GTPase MnmE [Tsuneonella aeria]